MIKVDLHFRRSLEENKQKCMQLMKMKEIAIETFKS